MWILQTILLIFKLWPKNWSICAWGDRYLMLAPSEVPKGSYLFLQSENISWWIVFVPIYMIIIRYGVAFAMQLILRERKSKSLSKPKRH